MGERKIKFTSKERRMLKAMNKKISVYELATIFKVSHMTIQNWLDGWHVPPYSTRIMIMRLYEEYKNPKEAK